MKTVILLMCGTAGLIAADWLTFAGDRQRTGWAKKEELLTRENVKGLKLEWSAKLDNDPVELHSLTAPVIVENVVTSRGFHDFVIVAGSSDNVYALDAESGKIRWQKKFARAGTPPNKGTGGWLCPNALGATPAIDKATNSVLVISRDGTLHTLNYINGEDHKPPVQFVPAFSKNWSLNLAGSVLYTATSQGCNRTPNGVWAMDLKDPDRKVKRWRAYGGVWGRAGVAIGFDGRIYAEVGDGTLDFAAGKLADAIVALEPKTLELADYYVPANQRWVDKKDLDMGSISPVVFKHKDRELVAGSGKEGAIYLLDAKSLGGADHRTPLYRSPLYTNEDVDYAGHGFWGALATWEDEKETRWLMAPAWGPQHPKSPPFPVTNGDAPRGSIMAFKVEEKEGKPMLVPAWRSVDMSVPEPPIIANGVVFALSNGENTLQVDNSGRMLTSKERADTPSGNAVLYALDGQTGKTLWSSGKTIPGFTHFSGLAISEGRVYVVTYDSHVYAFGLGLPHE